MKTGPAVPDPGGLDPDSYQLCLALHELFEQVEQSGVRAYARRCNLDASVVSKSLSCKEVPTWEFIERLAAHAAEDQKLSAPEPATLARLHELHQNMIASSEKKGHVLQALRSQLTKACLDRDAHARRVKELSHELEEARDEVFELSSRVRELEEGVRPLNIDGAQLVLRDGQQLRWERDSAEDTVAELRGALVVERLLKEDAEQLYLDYRQLLLEFTHATEDEEEPSAEWYKSELASVDAVLEKERQLREAAEERREAAERRAADLESQLKQAHETIGHLRGRYYPPVQPLPAPRQPTGAIDETMVIAPLIGPQRTGEDQAIS